MIKYKRIPFETIVNARDLGGFAAGEGKITRYGAVLRTDCPIGVSEKDKEFLKQYNVTLSIDLRGKDETISTPSGMQGLDWHTYIHCPITEEHSIIRSGEDGKEKTPPPPPPQPEGNFDMGDSYIGILEEGKAWAKKVITLIAEHPDAVMFHCFIGKDRAGLIAALVLGAVGVCDTDIMMDYSASMSCLRPKYNKMGADFLPKKRGRPDFSWGFFGSVPESMEAALCHMNEKYGGVAGYLLDCGVAPETLEKLRAKLLEDAVW